MRKIYYLKTCNTCNRVIKELAHVHDFIFQEIKEKPVTVAQLNEMHTLGPSYEELFNKRAKLYRERNLKHERLSEEDYRRLILEHYTFLKRPIIILDEHIFTGKSKKVIEAVTSLL